MKKTFLLLICFFLTACSGIMPYKDQNLDYLYSIQKDPSAFKGAVVAFNGEVVGIRENAHRIRLILRIDTPLYYYATGKGNSLSYELLYVIFRKANPRATKIAKEHKVRVLAKVDDYETRQDGYGHTAGVVRVRAIALADRSQDKDFYRTDAASVALYNSWKAGKLFFEETPEQILSQLDLPEETVQPVPAAKPVVAKPVKPAEPAPLPPPPAGIVFDPEEPPFILDPSATETDSQSKPTESSSAEDAIHQPQPPAGQTPPQGVAPLPPSEPTDKDSAPEGTLSALAGTIQAAETKTEPSLTPANKTPVTAAASTPAAAADTNTTSNTATNPEETLPPAVN